MVAFTAEDCVHGCKVGSDWQNYHSECETEEFVYHGSMFVLLVSNIEIEKARWWRVTHEGTAGLMSDGPAAGEWSFSPAVLECVL
jgi:hypothetical protein